MHINKVSGKTREQPYQICFLYFLELSFPVRIVKDILPIGLKAIVNKHEQNAMGMCLFIQAHYFNYFQIKFV